MWICASWQSCTSSVRVLLVQLDFPNTTSHYHGSVGLRYPMSAAENTRKHIRQAAPSSRFDPRLSLLILSTGGKTVALQVRRIT